MEILGEMSHERLDRWRYASSAERLVRLGASESTLIGWREHCRTRVIIWLRCGGSLAPVVAPVLLTWCKALFGLGKVLGPPDLLVRKVPKMWTGRGWKGDGDHFIMLGRACESCNVGRIQWMLFYARLFREH